jgi:hypothetical protein
MALGGELLEQAAATKAMATKPRLARNQRRVGQVVADDVTFVKVVAGDDVLQVLGTTQL